MTNQDSRTRQLTANNCPRCGARLPPYTTGRPQKWCSQRCRRAAYEERRAAASGAIALEIVEVAGPVVDHDLTECARRTAASPAASRRLLQILTGLAKAGEIQDDPKWEGTLWAVAGLADALVASRSGSRYIR